MGKSTISMAIFNSYFDITRGYCLSVQCQPVRLTSQNASKFRASRLRILPSKDRVEVSHPLGRCLTDIFPKYPTTSEWEVSLLKHVKTASLAPQPSSKDSVDERQTHWTLSWLQCSFGKSAVDLTLSCPTRRHCREIILSLGLWRPWRLFEKKHSTFVATRHASPLCHSRSLAGATPSGTKEECQMFCMLHSHMCKNPNIPAYMFLNVCSCCNVTLLLASGNDCAVRRNNWSFLAQLL